MLVALIVLQQFPPRLPRYPHLPWLINPSTPVAQSINGVTSNFARLNHFLATPNILNRGKSLACVALATNIVFGQPNNQVLEESSGGAFQASFIEGMSLNNG
jgi:hypothetical protein